MIIKICGIKNQDTLSFCEKNNVNYFGMIFYKNSPRNISFESAKELQNMSKKFKINGVGVFVNESVNNLKQYINYLGLKFIQLHGEEDNNSGTFPIQSVRFYNAIKGHGGTSKLVMLPKESHGYRAKESILHMLWEQDILVNFILMHG